MTPTLLQFRDNVTLLGGGELIPATLSEILKFAPNLVAADGAAARALDLGLELDAVIGDMDSLSPETRARLPESRIFEIAEQDSTDFDKALRSIAAPLIIGAGFMGARLDHELAVYNSLVRHPHRKCILVGAQDICLHVPERIALDLPPGSRLSLFPMGRVVVEGQGLRWPLDRLEMAPWGRVGTSNEVLSGAVELRFDRPGMLLILPRAALGAAIRALG